MGSNKEAHDSFAWFGSWADLKSGTFFPGCGTHLSKLAMKKIKIVLGLAAFYLLFSAGWQIGACELANFELKDDMQDMAAQFGLRIGLSDVAGDDDLRETVVRKAEKYGIALLPGQVTVLRDGYGKNATLYFAADYSVTIYLPGYSFEIHFTPSSGNKPRGAALAAQTSQE